MRNQVSQHYIKKGADYVACRQSDPGGRGHKFNFEYFRPYLRNTDVVLDFGCGNGGMLRHLVKCVAQADGLEVNPAAYSLASCTGCTVFRCLEDVPEAIYDVIVSNHVLEHVRDFCSCLEILRLKLKPGGQLVAKLPIDDWRAKHQRTWSKSDIDHHLQTWTPRLFANVLFETGYQVREIRVVTSAWHPRLFLLCRLGLGRLGFWAFAVVKRRRQLVAVGLRRS